MLHVFSGLLFHYIECSRPLILYFLSRNRKIRCDGAKPACHNCSKRNAANNDCDYDAIPKRRGPDRNPGARQRVPRDLKNEFEGPIRHRRRAHPNTSSGSTSGSVTASEKQSSIEPPSNKTPLLILSPINSDTLHVADNFAADSHFLDNTYQDLLETPNAASLGKIPLINDDAFELSTLIVLSQNTNHGYITLTETDDDDDTQGISYEPSLNFNRKVWFDSLLSLYIFPASAQRRALTSMQRQAAAQDITSDIRFLFRESNYWFSFFHVPTFFGNYFDPLRRQRIQPSLVLAMLAMSIFWQSSDIGLGRSGRERALRFRDEAQSALDASINAGWIDETLAQAAWVRFIRSNFLADLKICSSCWRCLRSAHTLFIQQSALAPPWSSSILLSTAFL